MRSKLSTIVLTALLVLLATPATAGTEQAREYFKQAKTAYDSGEYERAAKLLEKAYAEEANLTYQYNRIRALQGAEQYEKALDVLNTYEKPMLDAKGFEDIPELKEVLREKVDRTAEPSDAGSTSGNSSVEGPAESMTEPEPRSGAGSGGRTDTGPTDTMTWVGWGLVGTGVASIGVGSLYASTILLPRETREKVQNDEPLTDADDEVIKRQQTLSIVFLSVGAGALIGGGAILLTRGGSEGDASAKRRIRLSPWTSGRAGGAQLHIRF